MVRDGYGQRFDGRIVQSEGNEIFKDTGPKQVLVKMEGNLASCSKLSLWFGLWTGDSKRERERECTNVKTSTIIYVFQVLSLSKLEPLP